MSEYIIDMGNSSYRSTSGLLCADVSQLREEIVRCRDCKHHEYWEFRDGRTAHDCARNGDYLFDTEPDGFCAWGERNEKGKGND